MSDEKEQEKLKVGDPLSVTKKSKVDGPQAGDPVDLSQEDVTPITREPIKKVNANDWDNQGVSQLYDQLTTLENRLMYARQLGHADMIKQLEKGIARLRSQINSKDTGEIRLI